MGSLALSHDRNRASGASFTLARFKSGLRSSDQRKAVTVLYEAQDRIAYALEGATLAAEDALDAIRDRMAIALAVLAAVLGLGAVLLLSGGDAEPAGEAEIGADSP